MGKKIQAVDDYIEQSAEFARPMLKRMRKAFHRGCPEIEEAIKWGVPCFVHHGIVGGIAAFKKHVSLGFWKSPLMQDPAELFQVRAASMCNIKFEKLKDLPNEAVLASYVAEAAHLNETQQKAPKKKRAAANTPALPAAFQTALSKNKQAKKVFSAFPPSHQREYIEWIAEAKRDETRVRRIVQAIEWISEGKSRNWKYEKKS